MGKIFRRLVGLCSLRKKKVRDINFSSGRREQIYLDKARELHSRYKGEGKRPSTKKFREVDTNARAMVAVLWNRYLSTGLYPYYVAEVDGILYYSVKVVGDEVVFNVLTKSELVGLGYNPDKLEVNLTGGIG